LGEDLPRYTEKGDPPVVLTVMLVAFLVQRNHNRFDPIFRHHLRPKKGCLWALNPDKCKKLEEECKRCRQRDLVNIRLSMSRPDDLNKIERGEQRIKKCNLNSQRKLYEAHQQQQVSLNQHQTIGNTITTTATAGNNNNNSILSNGTNVNANASSMHENITIINNDRYLIDWTSAKTTPTVVTSKNLIRTCSRNGASYV